MARRRDGSEQPDLFSLLDGEGGGDQSGDSPDRGRGLHATIWRCPGVDAGAPSGVHRRPRRPGSAARWPSWPPQMGEQAVADWTARHGDHPDFMTKVGLLNTASASAKEMVLAQELYELIPEPPDGDRGRCWGQRSGADARSQPGAVGSALDTHVVPQRAERGRWRSWRRGCGRTRSSRRCSGSRRAICWRRGPRTDATAAREIGATRWPASWRRWCSRTCATTGCPPGRGPGVAVRRARSAHRSPQRSIPAAPSCPPRLLLSGLHRAAPAADPGPSRRRHRQCSDLQHHRFPRPPRSWCPRATVARAGQHCGHRSRAAPASGRTPGHRRRTARVGGLVRVGCGPRGLRHPRRGLRHRTQSAARAADPRAVPAGRSV